MNALDQAFIKAYAKEPAAKVESPSAGPEGQSFPLTLGDAPYLDGNLYRVDVPATPVTSAAVPPPHQRFARTGHALRSRFTAPTPVEPPVQPPPPQEISTLLPRPLKTKPPALSQIAKQLTGNQPTDLLAAEQNAVRQLASAAATEIEIPLRTEVTLSAPQVAADPEVLPPREVVPPAPVEKKKYRFDGATTGLRGPHFQPRPEVVAEESPAATAPDVEATATVVPEEVHAVETATTEVIAPDMAAVSKAADTVPAPETRIETKPVAPPAVAGPAWEVDAFQWPAVCDELVADKDSYFAQAGNKLLAAIEDGLTSLAVAGSIRGDGCSTLALVLARVAAQAGVDVALVDGDLADPQLGTLLGLEIPGGWQDVVAGKTPLSEVAVRSLQDKLTLYPLEKSELTLSLAETRVTNTLEQITKAHALTIIDLGPIAAGDAPVFSTNDSPPVDAVVIVRDVRRTPLDHVQAIATRLYANGLDAVGLAENFVSSPS